MEEVLLRALQWIICLLHFNELPLRHIIERIDGPYSGPKEFSGALGKQLSTCHTLPPVDFSPVESSDFPEVDVNLLSTDQKYLFEISLAVRDGICSLDWANRDPGNITHVCWLTTANRFLRLYVATETPSQNLIKIVEFIMKVYAPMWFLIKTKPSCTNGAPHLFKYITLIRDLSAELQEIVKPVIQRLLEVSVVNSFLLYNMNQLNKGLKYLNHRKFQESLITQLVGDVRNSPVNLKRGRRSTADNEERLDGRQHFVSSHPNSKSKDCAVSSDQKVCGGRKETVFFCKTCTKKSGLHPTTCFERYHTTKKFTLTHPNANVN
ncbi:unnamed protein product [Bemisia tabaci]|uniref:Uncharacterized protein n=1 Tax=Bemisia tabaci TaxID=7038 RepID=A0A9P0F451_BEMTA|nr:unnamed protein product [Bemisia tabaci]